MPPIKLVFLGTGCSGGTPLAGCLLGLYGAPPTIGGCPVCRRAAADPRSPERRNNPSLLLQSTTSPYNLVIDVGKTFNQSAIDYFPLHAVSGVDCVLLTHEHADAILGLDDLRVVQRPSSSSLPVPTPVSQVVAAVLSNQPSPVPSPPTQLAPTHYWTSLNQPCVVLSSSRTRAYIQQCFPYLTPNGSGGRFVSKLVFETFDFPSSLVELPLFSFPRVLIPHFFGPDMPLSVTPLPVEHGPGFLSAGFLFKTVCYLSDISALPAPTLAFLRQQPLTLLILDCLRAQHPPSAAAPVHFDLVHALDCVRTLACPRTLLVGMNHELAHDETNALLQTLPQDTFGSVQLAQDGLCLVIE